MTVRFHSRTEKNKSPEKKQVGSVHKEGSVLIYGSVEKRNVVLWVAPHYSPSLLTQNRTFRPDRVV